MEFKLVLVPKTPDEYLLNGEKSLCGLAFVEKASRCLRRNLDLKSKTRHNTLGRIAKYEISVPQAIAIESGWFDQKSVRYITCEANVLESYIFYGASMSTATNRPSYPWYSDEVVLSSYIDELAILDTWRSRGYPKTLTVEYMPDQVVGGQIPIVPDADDVQNPNLGDLILDDIMNDLT